MDHVRVRNLKVQIIASFNRTRENIQLVARRFTNIINSQIIAQESQNSRLF